MYRPARVSARKTVASNGFPSPNEPPMIGMPAIFNHCVGCLEAIKNIHKVGIHSARVTFGFSRMSRQKSKKMKATVASIAICGGKPIMLAIVGGR